MARIREGALESPLMPLDESVAIVGIMDRARDGWERRRMRIGVIGCGYVFDHYMATWARHPKLELAGVADRDAGRADTVARTYGVRHYATNEEMLADPSIGIVANFTSIESHFEVTRAALLADKHVYSEKPLTTDLDEARALFDLAAERGLVLSCAPSNVFSDTTQTMWKAVRDGAVGDVRIVYAEFDDNPIYLMSPETWKSRSGAPWPYIHEYEQGCTFEHAGYHLVWMCAIFGPVETVTAFSDVTIPDKTDAPLDPPDTPDFSVACLKFRSGIVARLTCSIGAPRSPHAHHRQRRHAARGHLPALPQSGAPRAVRQTRPQRAQGGLGAHEHPAATALRRRRATAAAPAQRAPGRGRAAHIDRGTMVVATRPSEPFETARTGPAGQERGPGGDGGRIPVRHPCFPPPDFILHVTELTLNIQRAGTESRTHRMETYFPPLSPRPETVSSGIDYGRRRPPSDHLASDQRRARQDASAPI